MDDSRQHFLSDKQVATRYGVNRSTIWRWVRGEDFPVPVKLSPGCARWPLDQIEAYENEAREESKRGV